MVTRILEGHRVLGFDLETTGLDPRTDRVVQYALIGSNNDGSHIKQCSEIDPGMLIPPQSTVVHGISNKDVRGKGEFVEHYQKVADLVDGAVIVGHNVISFDWKFLKFECLRIGARVPQPIAFLDTLVISRAFGIQGPRKLGSLCKKFGISLDRSHSADADAGATLLLLLKIMKAFPEKFNLSMEDFVESISA